MSGRLFWDAFTKSLWVRAVALALVTALVVVQCGREGGTARSLSDLNYDSLPEDAPRPAKPTDRLHAAVTELKGLLSVQAKEDLSDKEADKARSARGRVVAEVRALKGQFVADRAKLEKLDAKAALTRLDAMERETTKLERSLEATLSKVPQSGDRAGPRAAEASDVLTALSPNPPRQPLSADLGFGPKNADPRPATLSAGITPAYSAPTAAETASELPVDPQQEDLAETPETKVSSAIQELAQRLDRDPVKIYEYVRNEIRYQPYHGFRKGADRTLAEKSGSDADQAALTIALLRESGIHARFVQGVSDLSAARAANWLGVDEEAGQRVDAAPDILASGGIPTTQVRANGHLVRVRFNHVWAEAYVAADAYRGVDEQRGAKRWMPLDPSIKTHDFTPPVADLNELFLPMVTEYVDEIRSLTETVGDDDGFIAPTPAQANPPQDDVLVGITDELAERGIDKSSTAADILGSQRVRQTSTGYLPATLPFATRSVSAEFRAAPNSLVSRVEVRVGKSSPDGRGLGGPVEPDLSHSIPTHELAGARLTIAYVPASTDDAEVIDAYHGLFNTPAYAAQLLPVLRIDGRVVARGDTPVAGGWAQQLSLTYDEPGIAAQEVPSVVYAGSLSSIVVDLGGLGPADVKARGATLKGFETDTTGENVLTDKRTGELLAALGTYYFARNNAFNHAFAKLSEVHQQRQLSAAVVSTQLDTRYIAGFPVTTDLGGLSIDVDQDVQSVISTGAGSDAPRKYLIGAGYYASASEGLIFEHTLGGSASSTTKVLQTAAENRIPIYSVGQRNVDRVLPLLAIDEGTKREISEAVADGLTVTVPQRDVTIGGWTGIGYVVSDDETGAAAYRISGGANGGVRKFIKELATAVLDELAGLFRTETAQASTGATVTNAGSGIFDFFGDALDEPFVKAIVGCVAGILLAVLLHGAFAVYLAPWIIIPLSVAVVAGCLIGGMSALFNLGRLIPGRTGG